MERDAFILLLGDHGGFRLSSLRHIGFAPLGVAEPRRAHRAFYSVFGAVRHLGAYVFIAGLYDRQTNVLKRKLSSLIMRAQVVNSIIAVFFFYFISIYRITPKVNLFIYLALSVALILIWRLVLANFLYGGRRENVLLVGGGQEMYELDKEISGNANTK